MGCLCQNRKQRYIACSVLCLVFVIYLGAAVLYVWYDVLTANEIDYDLKPIPNTKNEVFIDAKKLEKLLLSKTGATVLDARTSFHPVIERQKAGYGYTIDGAYNTEWKDFIVSDDDRRLKPIEEIQDIFRRAGVSNDIPVVVFGSWKEEYGEEGRIYWQLDWLNHTQVYILQGGIFAWTERSFQGSGRQGEGDFVARPIRHRIATEKQILNDLKKNHPPLIIDSRTVSEYEGSTPMGESRGGHIPGAVSYHWENVFDPDGSGNLKPIKELIREFEEIGYEDKNQSVVIYCTSGVRAGFLYSVFKWIGHEKVAVYPDSMWIWTKDPELPLET